MKKLLIVSPFGHIGGAEISIISLVKHLDRDSFHPIIVCYEDGPFVDKVRSSGVEIHQFQRKSVFSNISIIFRLIQLIRKNEINLVHVNSFDIRAGLAAYFTTTPLIGHLRVIFPFTWIDYLFVTLATGVISVSNTAADMFLKKYPSAKGKFSIIPNAVVQPLTLPDSGLRKEFSIPDDSVLIGVVGRIDSWKGYEYFIQAIPNVLKKYPNTFFCVIGGVSVGYVEGEQYLQYLKELKIKLNLNEQLFFTGFRDNILSVIRELNILVIPSVEIVKNNQISTEGFGRVAVEAMMVKTPVIASRVGGLPEIIDNEINGLLISQKSPEAISESIIKILDDPDTTETMVNNAYQKYLDHYTIDRHVTNIQNFYKSLILS